MATFQDLSTELVLGILENVMPDDIESISLSSKRIYELAIPQLQEHRNLRNKYTNFKNVVEYKPNNWHDPGGLLADLLCKILSDARTSHYVKHIDLEMWNFGAKDGWKPDAVFEKPFITRRAQHQQDSKTHMEIIEEAVRAVEIIPSEEVDDWLHQIRRGNEDPLVALLLLHAPKLQTLKFIVPYVGSESSYLLNTIQRVTLQGPKVKLYPAHLRNVEMYCAEAWQSLDFVKAFMSLPMLASIKTDSLFVDDRTYVDSSGTLPQPSNVTEMSFRSGFLPEKAFSELLRGVTNLKSFAYNFRHLWRDGEHQPPFDCATVLSSLEANACHTLQTLSLGAEEIETSQVAPVRHFRVLREVELQTLRCFAVTAGKPSDLIGLLPTSLEKLAFSWYKNPSKHGVGTLIEAILALVRGSKTELPHLRTLYLSTRDEEESDALWDCLDSDETAQINPMLSFEVHGPNDSGSLPAWIDSECTYGQDLEMTAVEDLKISYGGIE